MISVIITTYEREPQMVLRALESVLMQTYKDIEIIIVDDSHEEYALRNEVKKSILNSAALHPEISIEYIPHEHNLGACAARNTGLSFSNGEYIAFLDDDDEWLPDKLEKQIKKMESSKAALVYCGCFCKNDMTGEKRIRKTETHKGMVFKQLLHHNFISSTSFPLIQKKALKEIGGFDVQMQAAQDYDVWIRISENYIIDCVDEPLVIYHEHSGEQITKNPYKKMSGLERINQKYQDQIDSSSELWHIRHIGITPYYSMTKNRKKALQIWFSCICKRPDKILTNLKYLRLIIKA